MTVFVVVVVSHKAVLQKYIIIRIFCFYKPYNLYACSDRGTAIYDCIYYLFFFCHLFRVNHAGSIPVHNALFMVPPVHTIFSPRKFIISE